MAPFHSIPFRTTNEKLGHDSSDVEVNQRRNAGLCAYLWQHRGLSAYLFLRRRRRNGRFQADGADNSRIVLEADADTKSVGLSDFCGVTTHEQLAPCRQ